MTMVEDTRRIVYVAKTGESSQPELFRVLEEATQQNIGGRHFTVECDCLLDDGCHTYFSFVETRLRYSNWDLLVCDITREDPAIMAALMVALIRQIPAVGLLQESIATILDPQGLKILPFHPRRLDLAFRDRLSAVVSAGLVDPRTYVPLSTYEQSIRHKVFVSYSHANKDVLERVMVHLKPLEVMGIVEAWSDRRVRAGETWRTQIRVALSRSRLAILLVSADYLASEFVVKHELPYLLSEGKKGSVKLLPVILTPCRYARDPELGVLQSVNDPKKPLLLLPYPDQEEVLDKLASLVEETVRDVMERYLASKALKSKARRRLSSSD